MLQDVPAVDSKKLAPNPLDEKYTTLQAKLNLIPKGDTTYKVIETYFQNTTSSWSKAKLENVWSVDGKKDGGEFLKKSAKLGNRKLLWHGTNVAVVAAILKGGLRIMPHSGMLPLLVYVPDSVMLMRPLHSQKRICQLRKGICLVLRVFRGPCWQRNLLSKRAWYDNSCRTYVLLLCVPDSHQHRNHLEYGLGNLNASVPESHCTCRICEIM